ncbi:hypothetical protein BDV11DRAFT_185010 [Aspergillus similis]
MHLMDRFRHLMRFSALQRPVRRADLFPCNVLYLQYVTTPYITAFLWRHPTPYSPRWRRLWDILVYRITLNS